MTARNETNSSHLPLALTVATGLFALKAAEAHRRGSASDVIALARKFVGGRYVWGGSSPSSGGFDCSGLMQYVFARNGVRLPRVAEDQYRVGRPVRYENLQPGDLIFLANTYKRGISHVGLYIGGGRMLHAKGRAYGIVIDSVGPFGPGHPGARRVLEGGPTTDAPAPPDLIEGVSFQNLPRGAVCGSVRLTVGHDPYPRSPDVAYAIEIDGEVALRFPEAGVILRFDSAQLADGEHVVKLVRFNRATGARFVSQTAILTTRNFR